MGQIDKTFEKGRSPEELISSVVNESQRPQSRRESEVKDRTFEMQPALSIPVVLSNEWGKEFVVTISDISNLKVEPSEYVKSYFENFKQQASQIYNGIRKVATFSVRKVDDNPTYSVLLAAESVIDDKHIHVFTLIGNKFCQFTCKDEKELTKNLRSIKYAINSLNSNEIDEGKSKEIKDTQNKISDVLFESQGVYRGIESKKLNFNWSDNGLKVDCGSFNYLIDVKGGKILVNGETGGVRPANEVEIYGISEALSKQPEGNEKAVSLIEEKCHEIKPVNVQLKKFGEYTNPNYTLKISDDYVNLYIQVRFESYRYAISYSSIPDRSATWGAFSVWVGDSTCQKPIRDMNVIEILGIKSMVEAQLSKDYLHHAHSVMLKHYLSEIAKIESLHKQVTPFKDK